MASQHWGKRVVRRHVRPALYIAAIIAMGQVASVAIAAGEGDGVNAAAIDWNRLPAAGKSARSMVDLAAIMAKECHVQPWEVILRQAGAARVRIERTPMLDVPRARCVFTIGANSMFQVTNIRERP